jgi:hypothetical protein
MPDTPIPWFGLAALIAMFMIPFLPAWLLEGPRKVRHWPQQHVCGRCDAPWTKGHSCEDEVVTQPVAAAETVEPAAPLHGELRRPRRSRELARRPQARISRVR